jgi:serine/threonine protein phosphatase 1
LIYAIGDIHGQATMLEGALSHLRANLLTPADTVVCLGDYIDRGEDSRRVFELLRAFEADHPNTVFLRGNHEDLLLSSYTNIEAAVNWLANGGTETLRSYEGFWTAAWAAWIPDEDLDFISKTLMEYPAQHYHFVHAGVVPPDTEPGTPEGLDPRLWIRDAFIDSDADFGKIIVFGHTVQQDAQPLIMRNKVGLDTGAVFGGFLSVAGFDDSRPADEFPEFSLFQVDDRGVVLEYDPVAVAV